MQWGMWFASRSVTQLTYHGTETRRVEEIEGFKYFQQEMRKPPKSSIVLIRFHGSQVSAENSPDSGNYASRSSGNTQFN